MIIRLPAICYWSVSAIALTLCMAHPAYAADQLQPRAEVNVRAGSERSILMTEFWAPLAQESDRVLYGDLRLMGDNDENREGNLGIGYRYIAPKFNSVLGANAWIDRRRTEHGNNFHQLTFGVESLGETIDVRANAYIQLNSTKTTITPNIGSTTPYLAGSGIFIDTNGFIVEEPQDGVDAEIGYRLPVLQKYIDTTRVYAGGYHFWGDTTENVTGFRIRTEAQINSIFSVGARFQHDEPRGSQGFLEATLRFPFKSKKLFQEHGLRSRLDESPERDIDIVTNTKVDTGLAKPVLNASGAEQRILYVDNTAQPNGTGTKENPFNTLANAQANLQANDILYINRGDGSTTGMDQGIVIDKANIQLIGSGSALTYNGFTLLSAGLAPVITNTQIAVDDFVNNIHIGSGVYVMADNAHVSGITVTGTTGYAGVYALAQGKSFNNVQIDNVEIVGARRGVILEARSAGSDIQNIILDNVTVQSATVGSAIAVSANDGNKINSVIMSNIISKNSPGQGISIGANTAGQINSVTITNASSTNHAVNGILVQSTGAGIVGSVNLDTITIANNSQDGIRIESNGSGTAIQQSIINNVTAVNNRYGVILYAQNSGVLGTNTLSNILSQNNSQLGVNVFAITNGLMNTVSLSNTITNSNGISGTSFSASGGGRIVSASLTNVTANNNAQYGGQFDVQTSSSIDGLSVANSNFTGNGVHGLYLYKNTTGTLLADLGGGPLGSVGLNRIFGNTGNDIRLNYVAGGNQFARNNWWGVNNAPTRVTLSASTTLDSTGYLAADPRP